ncbi:hypothetical protein MKEN_01052100 [Mycena kentingensis (nom. inval.)]|nr:hypothetical protein MKEN_01052100 [Mycena kentingensis (nom. inval.)]
MAIFRARRFCFCLSLRVGVCLLALLAMLVSGPGAAGSWVEVFWMTSTHPVALRAKIAVFIQGGVFSLVFLMSIPGFIAAANAARGAVYIYSKFLFISTPLIVLALLVTLLTTLHPEDADFERCLNGSTSPLIRQFCTQDKSLSSPVKLLPIVLLGTSLGIQFFSWIIAISYGEDLDLDFGSRFEKYYGPDSNSDIEQQQQPQLRDSAYPFIRR